MGQGLSGGPGPTASEWQGLLCPHPTPTTCHLGRKTCVSQGTLTSEAIFTLAPPRAGHWMDSWLPSRLWECHPLPQAPPPSALPDGQE